MSCDPVTLKCSDCFNTACVCVCVQAQRKRRVTGSPLVLRPSTKTSRVASGRRTPHANRAASANGMARRGASFRMSDEGHAPLTEAIDVMYNSEDGQYCSLLCH